MKVVLDTNVLLISLPKISIYRPIFDALLQGKFILAITESIFQEYIEIVDRKTTSEIATNLAELILALDNIERTTIYYKWRLIQTDRDDNKFVDCAISAQANFIVTNDNHFNELDDIPFPPVNIMNADEFLGIIKTLK